MKTKVTVRVAQVEIDGEISLAALERVAEVIGDFFQVARKREGNAAVDSAAAAEAEKRNP